MNLQIQLLVRMLLIAIICLSGSAIYVMYQTNQQSITEAQQTAKRIETLMKKQLLEMFQRYDFSRTFPDVNLWQQARSIPGSCTQFLSRTESRQRNLCNELVEEAQTYPAWFGNIYQQLFDPIKEVRRPVNFNALKYGTVLVSLNTQLETARAWTNLRAVTNVVMVSLLALCVLMFLTTHRLLRPAGQIVRGLEKMRQGHLDTRLPMFDIAEWKRTSAAINALAAAQQATLEENKRLTLTLMNAQEEEHRYLTRELHDEFGQCLAGINAVTTSIAQTAREACPQLLTEVQSISHITSHMMAALRNLLTRLRPAEVDDLGLAVSLKQLIKSWNQRSSGKTHYAINIHMTLDELTEPLPVNIYRIVQECLTNIAKHANANQATIVLRREHSNVLLKIEDDGIADTPIFEKTLGIGLLGIHERVKALGGSVTLNTRSEGGLLIAIRLPLTE